MLKSVCSGADPHVTDMFAELTAIVSEQGAGGGNLLAQMFPDKEGTNDENRPKSFYQVAIDIPCFGQTDSDAIPGLITVKLISEIIR